MQDGGEAGRAGLACGMLVQNTVMQDGQNMKIQGGSGLREALHQI